MPFGYWEAKDEKDDLDAEIAAKFSRGYPSDNIIFEDSKQAVLIQNRNEVIRCSVDDVEKLEKLLNLFFGYQRTEIQEFNRAVDQFRTDLPAVLDALRAMIEKAHKERPAFRAAARVFLVREMGSITSSPTTSSRRSKAIDLPLRVTFVSVRTAKITKAMEKAGRQASIGVGVRNDVRWVHHDEPDCHRGARPVLLAD